MLNVNPRLLTAAEADRSGAAPKADSAARRGTATRAFPAFGVH